MRFNEAFSKPVEDFEAKGAFNARVDVDTRLHIDPSLFKECDIPEFEGAYDEFSQYFAKLLSDYVPNAVTNQRYRAALIDKLSFSEVGNTCLGYSEKGTKGRGTGNRLAVNIANSIIEIYKLGINDPVVFELLPFFEDNIGPDRISDMAVSILIRRFIAYTQRVCTELNIPMQERATLNGKPIALPAYNRSILFVPKAVLCHLPVVDYWWEIAGAGDYNRNLRRRICEMIGI